jgi:hypothetical protein
MTWLVSPRANVKVGDIAGSVDGNGRLMIMIDQVSYYASRLIWLYMVGQWPVGDVDHKDRKPLNNKWDNLRDVPHAINCQNRSLAVTNKSGQTGVYWNALEKKWKVQIKANKVKRNLGTFSEFEGAVAARLAAEAKYFQPVYGEYLGS